MSEDKKQTNTPKELTLAEPRLSTEWEVGFKEPFRGQRTAIEFGIITKNGELVLEKISKELADHIVEVHNKYLGKEHERKQ